jgi:membrane-bound ClpP family serine protease
MLVLEVGRFMDAGTTALLLMMVGLVLIIAEVFIPSGGAISICAALTFIAGIYFACSAWWTSSPIKVAMYLASLSILVPVGVGFALWLLPHTPVGRAAILSGPTPEETEAFGDIERKHQALIGKTGVTVTVLNPAGTLKIDGERISCQSEGLIVEAGQAVRVISARVNFVVVRVVSPDDPVVDQAMLPPVVESPPEVVVEQNATPEQKPERSAADIDFDLS